MARWRTRTKVIILVAALAVLAGAGLLVWRLTRPAPAPVAATTTAKATKTTLRQAVSASGTIAPQRQSYLNFPAAGTVKTVSAQIGDTVTAGQVLATQDTTTLDAAVSSAEAAVNAASSSLDTLLDNGSATDTQIASARAQLASAQAKLTQAKADQQGATIAAPFAGVVAQVNLTAGAKVAGSGSTTTGAGTTTTVTSATQASAQLVIVDTTAWQVNATVGMADLSQLKQGMAVLVTPTGSGAQLPGTLTSIGIVGSTSAGTASFPIIVTITGNPPNLYIGGTADASVTVSQTEALTVPTAAVSTVDGKTVVTVVRSGTETVAPVTVGRTSGPLTEITAGLSEGDEVVIPAGARATGNGSARPTASRPSGSRGGNNGGAPSGQATPR